MELITLFKKKFTSAVLLPLILLSSCCIFKTDTPDLRITGQNFPSSVNVNQRFNAIFTVGNFSTGDCDAEETSQSIVNLKMTNRETGVLQVNNTETLNALTNNATQSFDFSIIIGTAGTYDLVFVADPNNTSGATTSGNHTVTGTVVVN